MYMVDDDDEGPRRELAFGADLIVSVSVLGLLAGTLLDDDGL